MQSYTEISDTTSLTASRQFLLDNDKTAISSNSGTAFPTVNLQVGMLCLRTDLNKLYELKNLTPTWTCIADLSSDFEASTLVVEDTRAAATTPATYNDRKMRVSFKSNTAMELIDGGGFVKIIGLRGYGDDTGGKAFELGLTDNNNLWLRSGTATTWGAWVTMLNSANYNNYAPTKTGTGASGTWPINISGQASRLDGSVQTIRTTLAGPTGNDYNNSALEVRGDGGTLVPAIGFHQPGKYAGVLQQQGDGWFAFLNQGLSAYQSLRVAELVASGNVTAYSDIRLKTDIEKIPDALNKVTSLNGYTYTRTDTGARQTGVIAQELIEVLPEAVSTAGEHMSVAYGNMAGLLIEAIKELNEKVSALTARVAELEAR